MQTIRERYPEVAEALQAIERETHLNIPPDQLLNTPFFEWQATVVLGYIGELLVRCAAVGRQQIIEAQIDKQKQPCH